MLLRFATKAWDFQSYLVLKLRGLALEVRVILLAARDSCKPLRASTSVASSLCDALAG
jgi:hypothetical protein